MGRWIGSLTGRFDLMSDYGGCFVCFYRRRRRNRGKEKREKTRGKREGREREMGGRRVGCFLFVFVVCGFMIS